MYDLSDNGLFLWDSSSMAISRLSCSSNFFRFLNSWKCEVIVYSDLREQRPGHGRWVIVKDHGHSCDDDEHTHAEDSSYKR